MLVDVALMTIIAVLPAVTGTAAPVVWHVALVPIGSKVIHGKSTHESAGCGTSRLLPGAPRYSWA